MDPQLIYFVEKVGWVAQYIVFDVPDGLYQLVIQGQRPNSNEAVGVAMDDIHLASCKELASAFLSRSLIHLAINCQSLNHVKEAMGSDTIEIAGSLAFKRP